MDNTEQKFREEYDGIAAKMSDASLFGTPEFARLSKRQSELQSTIDLYNRRAKLEDRIKSNQEALSDSELAELAKEDLEITVADKAKVDEELKFALIPKDPHDSKDVIVEIRPAAGGDESSLFAAELYRMYLRYAETKGWKTEIISESQSDVGGYKEIIFGVHGTEVYRHLKYESGVHRVQRVPATESQGRVHTSTVTVAVLPEAEETEIEINPNDLRIDVFRSGGHGGQSVNTTDSAVRITHLPTGTVVTCQDEKSQLKNKLKAMGVLRSRLLAAKLEAEQKASSDARKSQIGSGDRSEKIRTYNFPQDRVSDHRIGYTRHNLPGFMDGQIDDLIQSLHQADQEAALAAAGQ